MQDVTSGGGWLYICGNKEYTETLCTPLNFAMNLKCKGQKKKKERSYQAMKKHGENLNIYH